MSRLSLFYVAYLGMSVLKILALWLLVSTVTLITGWFLMLHGGVYSESAERSGESGHLFEMEMVLGQILMWPLFSIASVWEFLSPSNRGRIVSEYLVLVSHYAGYGLIFTGYWYFSIKLGKQLRGGK